MTFVAKFLQNTTFQRKNKSPDVHPAFQCFSRQFWHALLPTHRLDLVIILGSVIGIAQISANCTSHSAIEKVRHHHKTRHEWEVLKLPTVFAGCDAVWVMKGM